MDKLFKHQEEGVAFLKKKGKAILGDDMGLGKTRQAIVAAGETASGGEILVICPASLKLNWKREILQVFPGDHIFIYGHDEGKEDPKSAAWHIINYDILEKHMETIEDLGIETVIVDESHYIKNKTKRADLTIQLCRAAEQVYLLTGTVIQNRPLELWNQLLAIDHYLTRQHGRSSEFFFWKRYCAAFQRPLKGGRMFWDRTGASNLDELRRKMEDSYLRRKKEDVLDMPPKLRSYIQVAISKEARARYDTAFDDYIKWLQDHPEVLEQKDMANIMSVQHLVELGKVREVASLAIVDQVAEQINEMIESGEKVIVFTSFKSVLEAYKKAVMRCRKVELTGSTSPKKRQEVVDQFQNDPDTKVFFGNIDAAGVGITLTAATKVVFPDPDWNPAVHDQAEDRAYRIGQKETVNVYYFMAEDTVHEDIVLDMHVAKREINDAIQEGKAVKDQGRGVANRIFRKLSTGMAGK